MTRRLVSVLRILGTLVYAVGLHRAVIWLRRRRIRVLAYHACEDRESDFTAGLNSNTPPDEFAAQLDFYARYYNVIPLSRAEAGDVPPNAAVITFDDGYRSVLQNAFPLLRRRGMAATVFLVTRVVGNRRLVWVNELNCMLRRHPTIARPVVARLSGCPTSASPEAMIDAVCRNYDQSALDLAMNEIRAAAGVEPERLASTAMLYLTWDDVRSMQAHGITFGNHTASHACLPRLSVSEQRAEIAEARNELDGAGCNGCWIAYPFGRVSPETRGIAEELGCSIMLEVGLAAGPLDVHHLGRVPVSASSDAALFAQIEIVEPVKALLRRLTQRDKAVAPRLSQPLQAASSTRTMS